MEGVPFHVGETFSLQNGENVKNFQLTGLPVDKLLVFDFIGIDAFAQSDQFLFVSLEITTGRQPGVYPMDVMGSSPHWEPEYSKRIFGSKQVSMYIDPNSQVFVTVARNNGNKGARVNIDIIGRMI